MRSIRSKALLPGKIFTDFFLERHKVRTRSAQGQHWPGRPGGQFGQSLGGDVDETWSGKGGSQESLRMYGFPCFFRDFSGGVGSVVSPESLNMHGFL